MKAVRFLGSASLFVVGLILVLYGLLGLTFNEPQGGSTYVTLAGRQLDAHRVGAVSLVLGLAITVAGVWVLRRRPARGAPADSAPLGDIPGP